MLDQRVQTSLFESSQMIWFMQSTIKSLNTPTNRDAYEEAAYNANSKFAQWCNHTNPKKHNKSLLTKITEVEQALANMVDEVTINTSLSKDRIIKAMNISIEASCLQTKLYDLLAQYQVVDYSWVGDGCCRTQDAEQAKAGTFSEPNMTDSTGWPTTYQECYVKCSEETTCGGVELTLDPTQKTASGATCSRNLPNWQEQYCFQCRLLLNTPSSNLAGLTVDTCEYNAKVTWKVKPGTQSCFLKATT